MTDASRRTPADGKRQRVTRSVPPSGSVAPVAVVFAPYWIAAAAKERAP